MQLWLKHERVNHPFYSRILGCCLPKTISESEAGFVSKFMFELPQSFRKRMTKRGRERGTEFEMGNFNGFEIFMALLLSAFNTMVALPRRNGFSVKPLHSARFYSLAVCNKGDGYCPSRFPKSKRKSLCRIQEKLKIEIGSLLREFTQHTRKKRTEVSHWIPNESSQSLQSRASSAFFRFRNWGAVAFPDLTGHLSHSDAQQAKHFPSLISR